MKDAPVTAQSVRQDLLAEQAELDTIVAELTPEQWEEATPSPGWAIRDQIAHLAYFDRTAALAITDVDAFREVRRRLVEVLADARHADEFTLTETRAMSVGTLLDHWRRCRQELADASAELTDDTRIEWYGPSMGAKSFLTARLMESWAHGQDIAGAIGAERTPTDRLQHVAQLGYMTRAWSYRNRGLDPPQGEVRVELTAPSGELWTWGPDDAVATVRGTALDFCLVTSQRRNVHDTDLVIEGAVALDWLEKAQLFAGPPSDPPAPRGSSQPAPSHRYSADQTRRLE